MRVYYSCSLVLVLVLYIHVYKTRNIQINDQGVVYYSTRTLRRIEAYIL